MSPAVIAVIRANAPRVANNFESDTVQRIYLAAAAAAFLLAAWVMARFHVPPATRFAILISFLFGVTALGRYWFRLSLVPQPERYHLEMDMAFWLALVFLAWPWVARIPRRTALGLGNRGSPGLSSDRCPPGAATRAGWEQPIDIRTTIEYKTAQMAGRPYARAARLRPRHHRLLAQRLQRHSATHRRVRQRHRESNRCRMSSTRSTPATSSRSESTC